MSEEFKDDVFLSDSSKSGSPRRKRLHKDELRLSLFAQQHRRGDGQT